MYADHGARRARSPSGLRRTKTSIPTAGAPREAAAEALAAEERLRRQGIALPQHDLEPFGGERLQHRVAEDARRARESGAPRREVDPHFVVRARAIARHAREDHALELGEARVEALDVRLRGGRSLRELGELRAHERSHHLVAAGHRAEARRGERAVA